MAKPFHNISIVGAGQMGCGIAQVCLMSGMNVQIYDRLPDIAQKAQKNIMAGIEKQLQKGKPLAGEPEQLMKNFSIVDSVEKIAKCDLVIEAASENEKIKHQIFAALIPYLDVDTVVASNTSSLSITRLAAATDRPDKFIGIHFMNPAPVMQLVELIRGIATSEQTFNAALTFVEQLGKQIAVAEDFPAFIVNRILIPMINEAVYALYEGVAGVSAIDTALKLGANHPMGPLQLADFIGLDTCLAIMQVLHEGLADSKYRPCPLLVKYVEAGWLGKKTGRGFYDYSGKIVIPTR